MNSLRECLPIFGLLLLIVIIAFYDIVFLDKTFKVSTANSQALPYGVFGQETNRPAFIPVNGTDSSVLEEPIYEFIKKNLRQGILPLWNPHQGLGYPLIGMIQVAMFFPLNLILYTLPQLYAWDVFILSRLLLGGILVYFLMRTFHYRKIPAVGAAIVYMLSGPLILFQYWTTNVEIMAPLLILSLERLIRKKTSAEVALVALAIALTFFGGHPEHIFLVNVFGFAFMMFRILSLKRHSGLLPLIRSVVFAYGLGLGLSAVVLFPFLRNSLTEFWNGHPPGAGLRCEEIQERFITLAVPHFFQRESLRYDFTFAGWLGGYLGTAPLALAFFSLWNKQKKGLNYFFAITAFILLGKSYGLPVLNWIGYLPLFDLCRFAYHTPQLVALNIAVLAGMGIKAVQFNHAVFKKGLRFSLCLSLLLLSCLGYFQGKGYGQQPLYASLFTAGLLLTWQAILFLKDKNRLTSRGVAVLLVILLGLELFLYIHRERARRFDSFPKVPYIEFLQNQSQRQRAYGILWAFYPNTATGYRVDDFGIFQDLLSSRYVTFINNLVLKNYFKKDLRPPALRSIQLPDANPFLDLFNIKYYISYPLRSKSSPQLYISRPGKDKSVLINIQVNESTKLIYSEEVNIYERAQAFPRAFIVHRALFQLNQKTELKLLKAIHKELRDVIVVEHAPIESIQKALAASPVSDGSQAVILKYNPNEVALQATLENPGFLVLSDAYHPDWKAYVNGKASQVYATDYILRSVFLPAGTHEVRFVFTPGSFYAGLLVSGISFLIGIFLIGQALGRCKTLKRIRKS